MSSTSEWHEREYTDLVKAAQSEPENALKLTLFKDLVRQGKRPIIERRIVDRIKIEYQVRDRDA